MSEPSVARGTIPGMGGDPCVRCGEAPRVEDDFCGHCFWAVQAEIAQGWYDLLEWLKPRAAFSSWCVEHGRDL